MVNKLRQENLSLFVPNNGCRLALTGTLAPLPGFIKIELQLSRNGFDFVT
jgi:hypothetical protein